MLVSIKFPVTKNLVSQLKAAAKFKGSNLTQNHFLLMLQNGSVTCCTSCMYICMVAFFFHVTKDLFSCDEGTE